MSGSGQSALALPALAAALLLAAPAARAEGGGEASDEVEIEAERVEIDRASGVALFEGGVLLRHGDLELRCERLSAEVGDDGRLDALVATGDVSLRAQGVTATAARVRYEPGSGRVTLTGQPRVRSSGGELTGRSIAIHLGDGRVSVEGARGVFRIR